MKAIVFKKYGGPENLRLQDIPTPVPKDHEVLVKVHAVSINSWDWEILQGKPFANRVMFGLWKPKVILGCDIAGKVEAIGNKVKKFRSGNAVFGDISGCHWGGFAEYVCVDEKSLTLKPGSLSFIQAAAIPQAGVLALQGLRQGNLVQAKTVLINGAGGGVGSFAIQLAKMQGAAVTAVDKHEKFGAMQSLGADHVIDYEVTDFTRNGSQYDLILDVMGFHSLSEYRKSLSADGIFVLVGGGNALILQTLLLAPMVSLLGSKKMGILIHKPNVNDLEKLSAQIIQGNIKTTIDRVYDLEDTSEAMRYFGSGKVKGKVVIRVAG